MDKKLFGSILTVLILLSVLWAVAMSAPNDANDITISTNASTYIEQNWSSSSSRVAGAINASIVNITIIPNFTIDTTYTYNITNITIVLNPSNIFNISLAAAYLGSAGAAGGNNTLVKRAGDGSVDVSTAFTCTTPATESNIVQCLNSTGYNSNVSGNSTISIWFYVKQNKSSGDETRNLWTIYVHTNKYNRTQPHDTETRYWGVDDLAPRIKELNITDANGNVRQSSSVLDFNRTGQSGSGAYLRHTDLNVTAIIVDYNKRGLVRIYWGWNGSTNIPTGNTGLMMVGPNGTMTTPCTITDTNNQECLYSFTIRASNLTNGMTNGSIIIWANDSFNQTVNLTNGGWGYNFSIDNSTPVGGDIITLSKATLFAAETLKVTCIGGDLPGIAVRDANIKITKPSGKVIEKTAGISQSWTVEFKDTETNEGGLYKVDCSVTDLVGLSSAATQKTFRVFFSDTSSGDEFGAEAAPVAKTDISTVGKYSGVIGGKQGESKTFTIDGATAHTIEFIEVTLTSAKLRISSEPVEITLDVGKSMNVDLDGDGADDVKVTLTSIEDGLAKVDITNLAKQAEAEEGPAEEAPAEEVEGKSNVGLWITILVIIIVIGVGYYLLKGRKSKKGEVKFSKQDLGL